MSNSRSWYGLEPRRSPGGTSAARLFLGLVAAGMFDLLPVEAHGRIVAEGNQQSTPVFGKTELIMHVRNIASVA
jgi:hypothetical protein